MFFLLTRESNVALRWLTQQVRSREPGARSPGSGREALCQLIRLHGFLAAPWHVSQLGVLEILKNTVLSVLGHGEICSLVQIFA